MGVSFFERMNGRLESEDGAAHSVDFEIKCEAARLRTLLRTGRTRASGVIHLPPWAASAPTFGSLEVSAEHRTLTYTLHFTSEDDEQLTLRGRKDFDWRRPLDSMTHMVTELYRTEDPDAVLATGAMVFDNNDLPSFLSSFSLTSSFRHRDLHKPRGDDLPTTPAVTAADEVLFQALAEAIIEPGRRVPPVDERTRERMVEVVGRLPAAVRNLYRAGLTSLDLAARARTGRPFEALSVAERRRLLDGLEGAGGEQMVAGLWLPIAIAHFGRDDYLDSLGVPRPAAVADRKPPRWMANVTTPGALEPISEVECDVVVVGTGAGGAPTAAVLAEAGLAVAVVEEGIYHRRETFTGPVERRMSEMWRHNGANIALGNGLVSVPSGRAVGGTTTINSGTCLRTPDAVLREWRDKGFPSDFEPESFAGWLDAVSRELEVTMAEARWLGPVAGIIERAAAAYAADGVAVSHGPLPRNAPSCDGQGVCQFGCPTDAKRSSNVSWVPRALRAGAQLFTGMRARRILQRDRRAVGIEAVGADPSGATRVVRIRARAVVLSCGALATSVLLRDNDIRLPRLGRGLSIHPAVGAIALFGKEFETQWDSIPQGYQLSGLVDERVAFEGSTAPPQFGGALLPFRGAELTRWMDQWDRVGQFGFMIRDRNTGSVVRARSGRPVVRYDITDDVHELMVRGVAELAEVMIRGGASEVATGVRGEDVIRTIDEARALGRRGFDRRQIQVIGFHPLGTCAMGRTPAEGVVDFDHRVFGRQGLYVIDGASVPTSLGVNPQLTIMAMALRAASAIVSELS